MNKIFLIVGVILVLYLVAMFIVFKHIQKKEVKKNNFYFGSTNKKSNFLYRLFDFFYKFPITKPYIKHLYRSFEIYCPKNELINKKRAMLVSLVVWIVCAIELLFVFLLHPSVLKAIISIILIYIINAECIYFVVRRTEIKLHQQMVKFFEDVRHYYYYYKHINFAIEDALKDAGKEIKAHAHLILEVLDAEDIEKEIRRYNEVVKINYLKLFLSICVQVKINGDTIYKDGSVFDMNLNHLKKEIQNTVLKMKKIVFLFSGLIFMEASPILVLEACKSFGLSLLPELYSFYEGTMGIVILISAIVLIVVCYILLTLQRDINKGTSSNGYVLLKISELLPIKVILDNYTSNFYTKVLRLKEKLKQAGEKISYRQFIIKQFLFAIVGLFLALFVIEKIHEVKKYSYCSNVTGVEKLTSNATSAQTETIETSIVYYVNLYKDEEKVPLENIRELVNREVNLTKEEHIELVSKQVIERIVKYRNEYFRWYELIECIAIGIFAYYIPYMILVYKLGLSRKGMEQEVIQFQSIILMLMYIKNISILDILEMMEKFSVIFKSSIQICINEFGSGSEQALENLKKNEPYEAFTRIIDDLISSDSIGIVQAFEEINSERMFFLERRKDEDIVELQKKTDSATLLAYIPLIFIFAFYLIVPFMLQCYRDYQSITDSMKYM